MTRADFTRARRLPGLVAVMSKPHDLRVKFPVFADEPLEVPLSYAVKLVQQNEEASHA